MNFEFVGHHLDVAGEPGIDAATRRRPGHRRALACSETN
jgi:hypothetical protein